MKKSGIVLVSLCAMLFGNLFSCLLESPSSEVPIVYTLTFDKNDGSATGTMVQIQISEGSSVTLPAIGYSKPGWSFIGWSMSSPSGSVAYPDKGLFKPTGSSTLFATWSDDSLVPQAVNSLTIGVWMQDPNRTRKGVKNGVEYKSLGINTFVGLWNWPYTTLPGATAPWTYAGYTLATVTALKDLGLKAYAGKDAAAVNWLADHPEFDDTLIGYMLGDEPDMFKVNHTPANAPQWEWSLPDNWKTTGNNLKALDPSKAFYANFGKPFAGGFYKPEAGSTKDLDFAKYVDPTTVYSCDLYGITDPYPSRSAHGIWTYGNAVKHANLYSSGRPFFGFLEVSAPWKAKDMVGAENKYISVRMQPQWVMPIVWNMVISGAKGIIYFCHNFYESGPDAGSDGCLAEPGMPAAMKAADLSIQKYADILLSPDESGTNVIVTGPVEVLSLTKKFAGATYIFAMGHGNASNINGAKVSAVFNVAGFSGQKVMVLNENREVTMSAGSFTEVFDPYEIQIYKITP